MDKTLIARNFSRYAHTYDRYAWIQHQVASELLDRMAGRGFFNILELGCGTGDFTLLLRERFKQASIKAVDISDKMIEVADRKLADKGVELLIADASDPVREGDFDLITSSACFQWFDDLNSPLSRYRSLLKKNGCIWFSIFGPRTFCELDFSLRRHLGSGYRVSASGFPAARKLNRSLGSIFKKAAVHEARYRYYFADLKDLLDNIKYTGTIGHSGAVKPGLGRGALRQIERIYLDEFKAIRATYQVFFCKGEAQ